MAKKHGKKNKYKELATLTIAVLVGIAVFIFINTDKDETSGYLDDVVDNVNYKQLMKSFDDNESFVLYYGSKTCSACQKFQPNLRDAISTYDKDVTVYYVDIDGLNANDRSDLAEYLDTQSTPTLLAVKDGEITNRLEGVQTSEDVQTFFDTHNDS